MIAPTQMKKPSNWQDFEKLCKLLWGEIWDCEDTIKQHGRQGQNQRILIARAIYKDASYIILDEATNSLDANNEKEIIKNLNEFFVGKTVIIVAHRLSTVQNADNIVVLEKGSVVEQGSHQELVSLHGAYFNLVKNQLNLGD
jgi:ATP-binding cassette subfamily B protein